MRPRIKTSSFTAATLLLLSAIMLAFPATLRSSPLATVVVASTPPSPQSPYGVAGAMRWPDWGTFSQPADALLQTGAAWTREDFAWGLIQPRPDRFDWTATDRIVGTLADHKVNVLGIIAYSANWATPAKEDDATANAISFYPPDPDKYYTFVHALVSRYKHAVHHWEIWNEPDNSMFWKPAPDARQYAAVLKTAYRAVKDADPGAKVLSAGLSGNAIPFLEAMLDAGAGNSFDILALHPYAVPLNAAHGRSESRPEVHKILDVELNKYRAFLQRHNLQGSLQQGSLQGGQDEGREQGSLQGRPIWITEIGWPARDWGLDAQAQASYLAQTYALLLSSGIAERIFWYSFKDQSPAPSDTWGLIGWGAGPTDLSAARPALKAYSTSARLLSEALPGGRLQLAAFDNVQDFERQQGSLQGGDWIRSTNPQGSFSITGQGSLQGQQAHGGTSSGKMQYNFTAPSQAVDFAAPQPVPLPGSPTRLGLWVKGDASGNYLSAWLRDRDGELFKVRLGAVTGANDGWRYFESPINTYYFDWEKAAGSPANGRPDYPLSFVSFRLENTPDEPTGSGTIYLDDLQSWAGPDVTAVRFNRADGSVVDVLWSSQTSHADLPTSSASVKVTDRDGVESTLQAKGGAVTLEISDSPIYVLHKPANGGGTTAGLPSGRVEARVQAPAPAQGSLAPTCVAAARAADGGQVVSRYFSETGHNLSGIFRTYWEANGGLNTLGFPVTEPFDAPSSDGKAYKQQYFERARLEYHPENSPPADVQLGLLGVLAAHDRSFTRIDQANAPTGSLFFPETGQPLMSFKGWWAAQGGLPTFGFPISPELQERSAADGKQYIVQYFERNRLELHPEFAGTPREVMRGLLGVEYLSKLSCPR